jgi:hypothetical protein
METYAILPETVVFDNRRHSLARWGDYTMQRQRKSRESGSQMITASEIACFAYCPEQWRLEYGLKLAPSNRTALAGGKRHHWWKAIAERIAGGFISIGWALIVAVLVLLLWLMWR